MSGSCVNSACEQEQRFSGQLASLWGQQSLRLLYSSFKGYNTPELANAKVKQILDEVKKEMRLSLRNGLIRKTKTLIGKQPVKL